MKLITVNAYSQNVLGVNKHSADVTLGPSEFDGVIEQLTDGGVFFIYSPGKNGFIDIGPVRFYRGQ